MLKSGNNQEGLQLTEQQRETLRMLQETHPWYKIILKNKQDIVQWLNHPVWKVFQAYLSEMRMIADNALVASHFDKNGRDISDVLRGQINVYTELYNFREVLISAKTPEETQRS